MFRYAAQWMRVGFDYWKIPFELSAFANEKAIRMLLESNPSYLTLLANSLTLEKQEQPQEAPEIDSHGSVFGERMECSRGENGDHFCE
jgi:hypothetical protein